MTGNKKAASGAENTESDKVKSLTTSVSESPGNVKAPPGATAAELAALLRNLIFSMRKRGVFDTIIVSVLLDTLRPEGKGDLKC